MVKKSGFIFLLVFYGYLTFCQTKQVNPYYDSLAKNEKILKALGDTILDGPNDYSKLDALTDFIPLFVKTLKIPGSYDYPFDSIKCMNKIYSPDNKFRLYSWAIKFGDGTYRYYGAIHMNNPAKLTLIPLYDHSNKISIDALPDTILTNTNWFGILYYSMAMTIKRDKTYYILLGWNGFNGYSNLKIIDILTFDNNKVTFGAPIIKMEKRTVSRKVFQYNSEAIFTLKYVPEKNIITFDNLVPPNPNSTGKVWTYIPDGNYDYFQIKKGKLIYKQDVFKHVKMPDDGLPKKVKSEL